MCFSLASLAGVLVTIVIVCAVFALIRLVLSQLPGMPTFMPVVISALYIIMWAIVVIAIIWLVVDLLACLGPWPGASRLR